ncbi:hypothetical protein N7508_009178 [Penicillium antarcticum]|uniref:uncharacterized protein n=1 Tax=Penicillium antarcticum TaxID=416450 RepID=UPI002388E645|nr:uncharacterized protein N7508_009178 [Penicillium antarcticum]KAJ5294357.1 hypothetical protein N7508_009178 [Penicillium antarcticum]
MTMYNAYLEEGQVNLPEVEKTTPNINIKISSLFSKEALKRMSWMSLWLERPAIHPLGMNLSWTAEDADISTAVVIGLSASSKTARVPCVPAESWGGGTRGIFTGLINAREWIARLKPRRVVFVDFGARSGTLQRLLKGGKGSPVLEIIKTMIVQVGSEQKVSSPDDIKENRESMQKIGKIRFNTSGVRDSAVELTSAQNYYDHVEPVGEDWLRVSHDITPDIQASLGRGVSGERIEKGWSRLCQGSVGTQEGLVYIM